MDRARKTKRIRANQQIAPLIITPGAPNGIGPEVSIKAFAALHKKHRHHPMLFIGAAQPLKQLAKKFKIQIDVHKEGTSQPSKMSFKSNTLTVLEPLPSNKFQPIDWLPSRSIELAIELILNGEGRALVTGPIDKNALQRAGYNYEGHTEMLCKLSGANAGVTMMLASPGMKVTLVTTHIPLSKVSISLTSQRIIDTIQRTNVGLQNVYDIRRPRLAVLGLNPHASDSGLFGNEETTIIVPAIRKSKAMGINVNGPFSSDGFFADWENKNAKKFDAVICMYHDQGLIPLKLYDFKNSINITLGLPFLRTSVDHGVGYDIYGKNKADSSSMLAALRLALQSHHGGA